MGCWFGGRDGCGPRGEDVRRGDTGKSHVTRDFCFWCDQNNNNLCTTSARCVRLKVLCLLIFSHDGSSHEYVR